MRVAIVGPFHQEPEEGGVEQHVHHISRSFEELGIDVERWSWKVEKDAGGIRRVSLFDLGKIFSESKADIVHFHSTATTFSLFHNLGRFKGRAVSTIHAFYHHEFETTPRMKALSLVMAAPYKSALRRIGNTVAVSQKIKEEALQAGVPVKAVIGNGIPLGEIRKTAEQEDLRSDAIMVGRFSEQKGVFDFIKAFSGSGLDVLLLGYGEKSVERKVEQLCKSGGIRCIIGPSRKVVLSAIKSSKVFLFPSKYEPFGIVGIEALALGKPVVVYKMAGGPLDFIENRKNGLLVENTPEALRSGAKMLLGNRKFLGELSKNALRSSEAYDWPIIAKKMKAFYSNL